MMNITFIGHSCFFVELPNCCFLFDYYQGELPPFPNKPLYIFCSHQHYDHFNPAIFKLASRGSEVSYVLSDDISKASVPQREHRITFVHPGMDYTFPDFTLRTLASTDLGAAFLISTASDILYHAGDLNDWVWPGEPEVDNQAMENQYLKIIGTLQSQKIDAAFLVLDPRQEEAFSFGIDAFLRTTKTRAAFVMHTWGDNTICQRLKQMDISVPYRDTLHQLEEYPSPDAAATVD